ncbi:hypothetical protein [Fictibacillus norfolkensis]|jgi:hypothetical protein|uniref:Uncharacterized protein n=1 Tax=Fictibacillus norfolkensis TaxID=2762233 RepID=A0ABR8SP57_9BACL|nr:hypothetical protein [Fictibacillus norfolkensis]MBD7965272.1 hypothetical protein [Fictibacillus norfolkensis]
MDELFKFFGGFLNVSLLLVVIIVILIVRQAKKKKPKNEEEDYLNHKEKHSKE